MITNKAIRRQIRTYLDMRGFRYSFIAKKSGMSLLAFYARLIGMKEFMAEDIFAVANAAETSADTFNPNNILPPDEEISLESGNKVNLDFEAVNEFICYLTGEETETIEISPSDLHFVRIDTLLEEVAGERFLELESEFHEIVDDIQDAAYNLGFRAAIKLQKAIFNL